MKISDWIIELLGEWLSSKSTKDKEQTTPPREEIVKPRPVEESTNEVHSQHEEPEVTKPPYIVKSFLWKPVADQGGKAVVLFSCDSAPININIDWFRFVVKGRQLHLLRVCCRVWEEG